MSIAVQRTKILLVGLIAISTHIAAKKAQL